MASEREKVGSEHPISRRSNIISQEQERQQQQQEVQFDVRFCIRGNLVCKFGVHRLFRFKVWCA